MIEEIKLYKKDGMPNLTDTPEKPKKSNHYQDLFRFRVYCKARKCFVDDIYQVSAQGHFVLNGIIQTNGISDDYVVMRSTGLRDYKGELIFEYDVLKHPVGEFPDKCFAVVWTWGIFEAKYINGQYSNLGLQLGDKGMATIAGTIFDMKLCDLFLNDN